MRSVKEHLAKLNGKVASHELLIGEMRVRQAERDNHCPLKESFEARVREVEDYITADSAANKTTSAWKDRLKPFWTAGIGILFILALEHSVELLKVVHIP